MSGAQINFLDEIIVDNFAGGGGASTGIELATGRVVDIAVFQSTRPLRGATVKDSSFEEILEFQSTRPLRGATANVHKKYVHVCENRQKKLFSLPNAVCQSA